MALVACRGEPEPPRRPHIAAVDAAVVPRPNPAARRPRPEAVEGSCTPPPSPSPADGWSLAGYRPGPALTDLVAVGRRRAVLVGTTSNAVCVSDDGARRWTARLGGGGHGLASPVVTALPRMRALAVIAQGTERAPRAPEVYLSRDDGERWAAVVLPAAARAAGARARAFTDGAARLFVATPTRLWATDDGERFEGPRALPGSESDRVDACGPTLIARARVAPDWFYHRSDDGGATWRPFRLGAIGLEGDDITLRCVDYRGTIEAGRAPLPAYWTADGGRTWRPARYDARARQLARALADEPESTAERPRCAATPVGELACMEAGRLVLPDEGPRGYEVSAPMGCEHIRMVDDRRMLAFGRACGVYTSTDRGGLWWPVTTSVDPGRDAPEEGGRGAFLDRDTAWRLDGGVWWTDDGGARWRLAPSRAGRALVRGVFVDRERGVFVARDGAVLATQDGGRTWRFVLRGEVETLAAAGRWVMVTTSDRVRLSPDGGRAWRAGAALPASARLDPVLEVAGTRRWFAPAPGVRVVQEGDRVWVARRGAADAEVVRGLPRGYDLLAAHATGGDVDRVLLTGGAVLRRERSSTR